MTPREQAVAELARALLTRRRARPLRIALDGRTAAGKTTLASELEQALTPHGPVIRAAIDDFHRPRAERWRQGRDSPQGYYEDARDYRALRNLLLDPLGPDGDRLYRTASFDLAADRPKDGPARRAPETAMLIVEGSFLQHPAVVGGWDVVVLVDAPRAQAVARGAARDAARLGGPEAARALHEARYADAWDRFYRPQAEPADGADIVFDNTDFDAPRVRAA
ncbi:MAG: zeta toxin family protein [Caulobacteraceae bacterium]|nr:zeta toxin family protein [Caulobacteraceae bacterium]